MEWYKNCVHISSNISIVVPKVHSACKPQSNTAKKNPNLFVRPHIQPKLAHGVFLCIGCISQAHGG